MKGASHRSPSLKAGKTTYNGGEKLMPFRADADVDRAIGRKRDRVPHDIDWSDCPLAKRYPKWGVK